MLLVLALLACDNSPTHRGPDDPIVSPSGDTAASSTATDGSSTTTTPEPTTSTPYSDPTVCDPAIVPPPDASDVAPALDPDQEIAGAAPAPFAVHLSWPTADPSRSAAFVWRTDLDTLATRVEWGRDGKLDQTTAGLSYIFNKAIDGTGGYRAHEVRLCEALEPNTQYSYRVGGDVGWSPIYTFTTPPAPGTPASVRFAVAGDTRGGYETWGAIVAAMKAESPDFYVFTGDAVSYGASMTEWDAWFRASGDAFATRPLLPAHGNHESLAQAYFAQFALPGNEQWFWIRWGDLTLTFLNDSAAADGAIAGDEADLIDRSYAGVPGDWKVAVHHQPEYATCSVHGSNLEVQAAWSPRYEANGVNLVLTGHNHLYERSVPIVANAEVAPGEGPVYVVTGGGGAVLYKGVKPDWFGAVANPIQHYVIVDVTPEKMTVTAKDLAGNILDTFDVPR